MKFVKLCMLIALVSLAGCATKTRMIKAGDEQPVSAGLNNNDFLQAANESVDSMLASGAVERVDGKKNILVISSILNDTMQRIDTDQLIKKIRIQLLQSGKVKTTTAIGLNGSEDKMNDKYAQLKKSGKIKKSTLVKQKYVAPNLSLSGKIIQRNNRLDGNEQLVEYYFQLTLTDLSDGLGIWEGETPIRKVTSSKTVSW